MIGEQSPGFSDKVVANVIIEGTSVQKVGFIFDLLYLAVTITPFTYSILPWYTFPSTQLYLKSVCTGTESSEITPIFVIKHSV